MGLPSSEERDSKKDMCEGPVTRNKDAECETLLGYTGGHGFMDVGGWWRRAGTGEAFLDLPSRAVLSPLHNTYSPVSGAFSFSTHLTP